MKSLYERCMDKADELEQAARYLRAMAQGNAQAADDLDKMCEHQPYRGAVLAVGVEQEIADVHADADDDAVEPSTPGNDGTHGPGND